MRILTKKALQDFWNKHPNAENALRSWFQIAKKAEWNNLAEVKKIFRTQIW